jgi:hypothetical protein
VVRHPAEVVQSLLRRNRFPEQETAPHWLHYMLEAERLSRGLNRAVIFYDDLLRDWRDCIQRAGRQAAIDWPLPFDQASQAVDAYLAVSARHYRVPDTRALVGPPGVCDMVNAAWTAFRFLAQDPTESVALTCLDHLRAEFAVWRRKAHPPGLKVIIPEH